MQQGVSGKAQNWKSRRWTTASGTLKANVPAWELLLHEMSNLHRQVQREHAPAHVNVHGNEVANGLAMKGMCSNLLWSGKRCDDQDSDTDSTVGPRDGLDSDTTEGIWQELGPCPMDSDEVAGEPSGAIFAEDMQTASSTDS